MNCGGVDRFWYVLQYLISNLSGSFVASQLISSVHVGGLRASSPRMHREPAREAGRHGLLRLAERSVPRFEVSCGLQQAESVRGGGLMGREGASTLRDSRRKLFSERAAQV